METAGGNLDERRGLPSASSFPRYATCPGSIALEFQLREAGVLPVDHGSGDAESGTRIHEILKKLATGAADPFAGAALLDIEVAEDLWERAQHFIKKAFGEDLSAVTFIVEQRHWLHDVDGSQIASGQFDLMAHNGVFGLVLDYKTLFGEHDPAPINRQLQFGAVILREAYGIREGMIVLLQRMKPASHAFYNDEDLADWLDEIDTIILRKSQDPFALGFVRSHHCTFCAARLACPRLQYEMASIQASPLAILATATDEQIGTFLDRCESVDVLKRAAEREVTVRIESGREVPGWTMAASAGKREVTNPRLLANELIAAGAPLSAVLGAMKLTVGDAQALHKAATGLKGRAANTAFNELSAGMVRISEPAPTLKRA